MHNFILFLISFMVGFQEFTIEDENKYFKVSYVDYIKINDDLYIYETIISKDCKITLKNLNNQLKEYNLEIKPEFSKFKTCNKLLISNITIFKDTLIFVTSDKMLKYNYNVLKDEFEFFEVIDLEKIFNKQILYYGTKIFLDYPYLYGWNDAYNSKRNANNLYYYKVNLNNINNSEFFELDLPKGFYWTLLQPRNIIDFTKGKFSYTHITEYEIYINNFSTNIIDTIKRDIPNWKSNTYSNDKFNGMHPVQIAEIIQKDSVLNCLIHKVNFINDSTLLVCYSNSQDENKKGQLYSFTYDIWKYYGSKWHLQNEYKDKFELNSNKQVSIFQSYKIFNNNIYSLQLNEDDEKYHIYKFNPFND